eukprot:scaffold2738_cov314-Pinguiococcus_pyrenoidosus.AAC.3
MEAFIGLSIILLPEHCSRRFIRGRMSCLTIATEANKGRLRRQKVFWFSGIGLHQITLVGHKIWVVGGRSQIDAPLTRLDSADLASSLMQSDPAKGADDVFGAETPRPKTSLEH